MPSLCPAPPFLWPNGREWGREDERRRDTRRVVIPARANTAQGSQTQRSSDWMTRIPLSDNPESEKKALIPKGETAMGRQGRK